MNIVSIDRCNICIHLRPLLPAERLPGHQLPHVRPPLVQRLLLLVLLVLLLLLVLVLLLLVPRQVAQLVPEDAQGCGGSVLSPLTTLLLTAS